MTIIHVDHDIVADDTREALAISAVPGERLLDRLEGTTLSFRCRASDCASCRVRVKEGGELLEPPSPDEVATLRAHGADQDERLACQIVVLAADGLVTLVPVRTGR